MNIIIDFEEMQRALKGVLATVNDSTISSDNRNFLFWVNKSSQICKVVSKSIYATTYTNVKAAVMFDEEDKDDDIFVQLQAKRVDDILKTYTSLSTTTVIGVEFSIKSNTVIMIVREGEKGKEDVVKNATKFRLAKLPIMASMLMQIKQIPNNVQMEEIQSKEILYYLDAFLPMFSKDNVENNSNRIYIGDDNIYAIPLYCAVILKNKLYDKGFNDFILRKNIAKFIKVFISFEEVIKYAKQATESGYILLFENSYGKVVIQVENMESAFSIEKFVDKPNNGIVISSKYMTETIKRLSLTKDTVNVEINITADKGQMMIISQDFVTYVPVAMTKGMGRFEFSVLPEILSMLVMNHWRNKEYEDDYLFILVNQTEKGYVEMCVMDKSNEWFTKVNKLILNKKEFNWER